MNNVCTRKLILKKKGVIFFSTSHKKKNTTCRLIIFCKPLIKEQIYKKIKKGYRYPEKICNRAFGT